MGSHGWRVVAETVGRVVRRRRAAGRAPRADDPRALDPPAGQAKVGLHDGSGLPGHVQRPERGHVQGGVHVRRAPAHRGEGPERVGARHRGCAATAAAAAAAPRRRRHWRRPRAGLALTRSGAPAAPRRPRRSRRGATVCCGAPPAAPPTPAAARRPATLCRAPHAAPLRPRPPPQPASPTSAPSCCRRCRACMRRATTARRCRLSRSPP
jgi:hypothetical protein